MLETNIVRVVETDFQNVMDEIMKWKEELDGTLIDSIINETLETVIDIILDNSECETVYENI